MTEDRGQRTDDRRQRTDDRIPHSMNPQRATDKVGSASVPTVDQYRASSIEHRETSLSTFGTAATGGLLALDPGLDDI